MVTERPLNFLLLEDDEDDYFIIRSLILEIWGNSAQLVWMQKAAPALAALQSGSFDAALADYNLGGENGIDFIRSAIAQGSRTPCILVTGYSSSRLYRTARQAGAAGYIDKDRLDAHRLRRTVEFALRHSPNLP